MPQQRPSLKLQEKLPVIIHPSQAATLPKRPLNLQLRRLNVAVSQWDYCISHRELETRVLLVLTKYLSEATLTRMRSSPTLTFSPSDLCLDAGWMVHQQDSPAHQGTLKSYICKTYIFNTQNTSGTFNYTTRHQLTLEQTLKRITSQHHINTWAKSAVDEPKHHNICFYICSKL